MKTDMVHEGLAMDKLAKMVRGLDVVTNGAEIDIMIASGNDMAYEVRSLPNPGRCGLLDQYIAWIGEERKYI